MESSNLPIKFSEQSLARPELAELQFVETLPLALVSLLERRYLSEFNLNAWRLEARKGDEARPLLREVVSLGRPQDPLIWAHVMPYVLTACHDPGHALVTVLHGQGKQHRLYLGGRRLIGQAARSTEDYLHSQESAFKAYFPGLQMGALARLDGTDLPELANFLGTAPAFAAVTGIPSISSERDFSQKLRSLDRFVEAVGNERYALMVVAEPLESFIIDRTLDLCRQLLSEVHTYTRFTKNRTQGGSEGESWTDQAEGDDWSSNLPTYLFGLSIFCQLIGILPELKSLASLAGPAHSLAFMASLEGNQQLRAKLRQSSKSQTWSEAVGIERLDANAEACEQLLRQHINRLQLAKSGGWWQTAVYAIGERESTVHRVTGALRSLCSGESTPLDPMRAIYLPGHLLRGAVERGQILNLFPDSVRDSNVLENSVGGAHPLGESFDIFGTCLNSAELAALINLPQQEIPGLPMHDWSNFALSVPPATEDAIALGTLQDNLGRNLSPVTVTASALNRHAFITGITGSGKTNTCMQVLLESYGKLRIPFLVIEPAKAEYRRLASHPTFRGKLRVCAVGGDSPLPFRLNPLSPVPGIPLGRHIDLLKAVFNASFPMYAAMPYILEEAILEIYTERGWSLYTSKNAFLSLRATSDERNALLPCLQDLYDKIEVVLARLKYAQEVHRNMGAALRSRLRSLMVGNKGLMLNTRRSVPLEDLFAKPTVIELQNLGDDEEKAFVMALLFVLLYEYAEMRQRDLPSKCHGKLQHLTLVEEAHRLLQATRGSTSAEVGDPRGKAVSMFADMLAEMRAYGEGFIIADQIPTKLAPEILKNSNLKVVHRLVAPDDRQITGSCINLTERQVKALTNLPPGLAVIHDERIGEAILARIPQVKDLPSEESLPASQLFDQPSEPRDKSYLYRHAGCRGCPSPCDYYHYLEEASFSEATDLDLKPFLEYLLVGEMVRAWDEWLRWRTDWHASSRIWHKDDREVVVGMTYCAATQVAYEWLGELAAARRQVSGKDTPITPEDRLQREKAARCLSELLRVWAQKAELDGEAQEVFEKGHHQLIGLVAGEPLRELPGCQNCPVRCQMLPFVAPYLSHLLNKVMPILLDKKPASERLLTLEQTVAPIQQTIPILHRFQDVKTAQRHWLYCLATNIKLSDPANLQYVELLEILEKSPESLTNRKVTGEIIDESLS